MVGSLHKDSREDPGSWTHITSTLTRKVVWLMLIPMLIFQDFQVYTGGEGRLYTFKHTGFETKFGKPR